MPRYYFHVRDHTRAIIDEEGIELPDLEAAREEAVAAARELMSQSILKGESCDGRVFDIADVQGCVVLSVPFSDAIGE